MVRLNQKYTHDPLVENIQNVLIDKFMVANTRGMTIKMIKINRTTVVVSNGNLTKEEFDYFIKRLKEKQARIQIEVVMNKIIQLSNANDAVVLISPLLWNIDDFNISGLNIRRTDWSIRSVKVPKGKTSFLSSVVATSKSSNTSEPSSSSTSTTCIVVA